MLIVKEKTTYHEFALVSEYDSKLVEYCRYLKATLGWQEFSFDSDMKKWRFKDPAIVLMLKDKFPAMGIEDEIERELGIYVEEQKKEKARELRVKEIKEATSSNIQIKGIKGELYPYQKLGVEFFLNNNGRAILADEPGTGKTLQSLAYMTHVGHKRTLVICPASVKFAWENEVKKWTGLKSFVINPNTDLHDIPHDTNVIITNYDTLKKFYNQFMKYRWDCLVVDEAHYCKSNSAARTKVVKQLAKNVESVLLLTGTPILSRPIELFNLLHMVDPKTWNNWYSYAIRYAEGKQGYWGFEAKGASNLEELKQRIGKYFLRRTKSEVLPQLPPKNRIEVPVELSKEFREQYHLASKDLVKYLKEHKKSHAREIMNAVQAETLVRLNLLRQISSMGKLDTAKEVIEGIIDSGGKVVVFSCFNAPLEELQTYFGSQAVLLLGTTKVEDRGALVKKFQEDPKVNIFLAGVKAGGIGITLTAASSVVFIDQSWTPADMQQAEDRTHRPGQVAQSVDIYNIISRDTIDGFMKKLLRGKQAIFDQLVEGESAEGKLTLDDAIEEIKQGLKKK